MFIVLLAAAAPADARPPSADRESADDRTLDDLDVPEALRDSTAAEDLAEDEQTLRARRARDAQAAVRSDLNALPLPGREPTPPASWRWLPRVTLLASAGRSEGRRELRALAFAELPLGERTAPTAIPGAPVAPPIEPARAPPAPRLDPAERDCLARARERTIALASAEPDRAQAYLRRARRAGWLPELRLRAERRLGRDESLDLDARASAGPLGLDTTNDVRYEVRATWDLSRIVFSPEELAAQAHALRMADARRELTGLVGRLYFERRRLVMDMAPDRKPDPTNDLDPAAARLVRIDEIETELDALTGGALRACEAGLARGQR
jgi:hypothetical protein